MTAEVAVQPFADERLAAAVASVPRWMDRSIFLGIAVAAALGLAAASLLPWNETVTASLYVTRSSPPRSVRVEEGGPLTQIRVREGSAVAAGEVLAVTGRDAYVAELERVRDYARRAEAALRDGGLPPSPIRAAVGGEVQGAHEALSAAVTALREEREHDVDAIRIRDLERSIEDMEVRYGIAGEGIKLRRSMSETAAARLRIHEDLARKGLVSKDTLFARRQELIAQQVAASEAVGTREELLRQIRAARADLAAALQQRALRRSTALAAASRALERVAGALENRQRQSTLVAPVGGIVHFASPREVGEALASGDEFAVVVPPGDGLRASGDVPASARREVVPGSIVRVEAHAYPATLYGYLEGRVERVSAVAVDGAYNIVVRLPSDAITSRGMAISLRDRSMVTAVITTRKVRIYEILLGTVQSRVVAR
jgi:multidrug efflux pump subunit AcrA (membrane-fusion protein)